MEPHYLFNSNALARRSGQADLSTGAEGLPRGQKNYYHLWRRAVIEELRL